MSTTSYSPTGALQYFSVPGGITVLRYLVSGGAGGQVQATELGAGETQPGGPAANISGYLPVTPGEQLWVAVGGGVRNDSFGATNGAPFGGGGTNGGGASSAIGRGTVTLANALVVAGGGGGGGEDGAGGAGGGIGGRAAGNPAALGGGQDPTYTSDIGESTGTDGTGGGGGGVIGGRAGTLSSGRRGGGGGGSSRVPSGASITNAGGLYPGQVQLTYGLPPFAPRIVSPAAGSVLAAGRPLALVHEYVASSSTGDHQTSAVVTYTTTAGGGSILIDGEGTRAVIPAALAAPGPVSWSVATTGQGGAAGPSASSSATLGVPPAKPVITSPPEDSTATGAQITVTWTAAEQAAYRVRRRNRDASVVYSLTEVVDAGARTATVVLDTDGRSDYVDVEVRGAGGVWSDPDTVRVRVSWTRPVTPSVALTPDPATASLFVAVTREAPAANRLAAWQAALAGAKAGTGTATILAIGDSFTEGQGAPTRAQSWQRVLAGLLRAGAGRPAGGADYLPVNFANFGESGQTFSGAAGTAWTSWRDYTGGYDLGVDDGRSLGHRSARTQPGATLTYTLVGTSMDVWWINDRASTFTVRVDGGSATTLTTTTAGGPARQRVPLGATGSHTVVLTFPGVTHLAGIAVHDGDEAVGVRVIDGAHNGYNSGDFLGMGAVHNLAAPDLVTICLGFNDHVPGHPPEATAGFLAQIVAEFQAQQQRPTSVAILVPQSYPGPYPAGAAPWSEYKAAMRSVGDDPVLAVAVVELPDLGTSGSLYASDGQHPNASGHALIASSLRTQFARVPSGAGARPAASTTFAAIDTATGVREGIVVGPDGRWRNPAGGVDYVITATDRDELGVPATGTSPGPTRGWGRGPWAAGPWGS